VLGTIDVSRHNFGILLPIPKVPGADSIKQYRPITLINVIFKFIAKAYATRLSQVAYRTIMMRYGVDIFSPSSWEPQEEGMMNIAARFSLS
jgi:hypothetical protein